MSIKRPDCRRPVGNTIQKNEKLPTVTVNIPEYVYRDKSLKQFERHVFFKSVKASESFRILRYRSTRFLIFCDMYSVFDLFRHFKFLSIRRFLPFPLLFHLLSLQAISACSTRPRYFSRRYQNFFCNRRDRLVSSPLFADHCYRA